MFFVRFRTSNAPQPRLHPHLFSCRHQPPSTCRTRAPHSHFWAVCILLTNRSVHIYRMVRLFRPSTKRTSQHPLFASPPILSNVAKRPSWIFSEKKIQSGFVELIEVNLYLYSKPSRVLCRWCYTQTIHNMYLLAYRCRKYMEVFISLHFRPLISLCTAYSQQIHPADFE